ncbi:hypothetical protein BH09ACT6_BH09ACT6_18330 [soil metagenome]
MVHEPANETIVAILGVVKALMNNCHSRGGFWSDIHASAVENHLKIRAVVRGTRGGGGVDARTAAMSGALDPLQVPVTGGGDQTCIVEWRQQGGNPVAAKRGVSSAG